MIAKAAFLGRPMVLEILDFLEFLDLFWKFLKVLEILEILDLDIAPQKTPLEIQEQPKFLLYYLREIPY